MKHEHWLKFGEQSKPNKIVKEISKKFVGTEYQRIYSILKWMNLNIKACKDEKKVLKIFATRNINKIIKDGFSTGCHDDALIFTVFCRLVGIPAKYLVGISKTDPLNYGHCVVEIYISNSWILVDQSKTTIYLVPKESKFYDGLVPVGTGLDSWEVGIKSFKSWMDKAIKVKNKRIK